MECSRAGNTKLICHSRDPRLDTCICQVVEFGDKSWRRSGLSEVDLVWVNRVVKLPPVIIGNQPRTRPARECRMNSFLPPQIRHGLKCAIGMQSSTRTATCFLLVATRTSIDCRGWRDDAISRSRVGVETPRRLCQLDRIWYRPH